ncbi:MAG: hypothetical protein F6K23_04085 [Okeania sp. SIO2C9]|uniref:hypothetical protein n=1 Tax=Okeania sp. SIO2C9 TaxID=2607791 RepID=UPI0013C09AA2|nr:hypothetical protein [Okeania sp. SIO2C9]NEQ72328.1 hypothetical protein [Okeania sp. SIO2C9]
MSPDVSDILNQLIDEHNEKLELKIAELEEELSEVTITLLDVDCSIKLIQTVT